jgi:predicted RNA binding protein YcfA (HicA-like mRNA interferase family)
MSRKLPVLSGSELIEALRVIGFEVVRSRGSHRILKHADGRSTVVPDHAGESLGPGLLRKIMRDVELDREQLRDLLR